MVRHGTLPEREVMTGTGRVPVEVPRVRDRKAGVAREDRIRLRSSTVPPYLRKPRPVGDPLPRPYPRGISTGDFGEAPAALPGPDAEGLSPSTVTGLKATWKDECETWRKRDLSGRRFVHVWADGGCFTPRLDSDRRCMRVVIGADEYGEKDVLAVMDGFRGNADSWRDLLRDLRDRGLEEPPELAVGDGAPGFRTALRDVCPKTRERRCWVHRTSNVTGALPRPPRERAKSDLHEIWMAETKREAEAAFGRFVKNHRVKYERAVAKPGKDRDGPLAFHHFPAEHCRHIRTTNPVESVFATVRNRTRRTRGCLSGKTALSMVYRLMMSAKGNWRRLPAPNRFPEVFRGGVFSDGIIQESAAA